MNSFLQARTRVAKPKFSFFSNFIFFWIFISDSFKRSNPLILYMHLRHILLDGHQHHIFDGLWNPKVFSRVCSWTGPISGFFADGSHDGPNIVYSDDDCRTNNVFLGISPKIESSKNRESKIKKDWFFYTFAYHLDSFRHFYNRLNNGV